MQCRSDGAFPAEVRQSQLDDEHGPARLLARLTGTGTISCSNGLTGAPLQIEQTLELVEQHPIAGTCFKPSGDVSKVGHVRGRSQLSVAISAPDGDTRRREFHGLIDGSTRGDEHDSTRCLLDLDIRARAPSGARLSLQLLGVVDRQTETLISGLYSASDLDTL